MSALVPWRDPLIREVIEETKAAYGRWVLPAVVGHVLAFIALLVIGYLLCVIVFGATA